ncbi:hypothetical protein QI229_11290 [Staphylococcus saprophyticus]|nr:hypothetical protein [Staphylococcus saprophyticus]MDW4134787.1 hypothetical protein [Staphylococcus saprophyticus]
MVKIKRKVEKNLPQLIEWGFNNPELVKGSIYKADESYAFSSYVSFPGDGAEVRVPCTITKNDTFTIEVEEEITEDTVIPKLVSFSRETHGLDFFQYNNSSINEEKDDTSLSFYIMNDDYSLVLIWTREKGLVE